MNSIQLYFIYLLIILFTMFSIAFLILIKKNKVNNLAGYTCLILSTAISISLIFTFTENKRKESIYNDAISFVSNNDYISAMNLLFTIEEYKNSEKMMEDIYEDYMYQLGIEYELEEDWINAMKCFIDSYNIKDSKYHLKRCSQKYVDSIIN